MARARANTSCLNHVVIFETALPKGVSRRRHLVEGAVLYESTKLKREEKKFYDIKRVNILCAYARVV